MKSSKQATIVEEIETVFDALAIRVATSKFCPRCSTPMRHAEATFFFGKSSRYWNIYLPVCPQCDFDEKELRNEAPHAA